MTECTGRASCGSPTAACTRVSLCAGVLLGRAFSSLQTGRSSVVLLWAGSRMGSAPRPGQTAAYIGAKCTEVKCMGKASLGTLMGASTRATSTTAARVAAGEHDCLGATLTLECGQTARRTAAGSSRGRTEGSTRASGWTANEVAAAPRRGRTGLHMLASGSGASKTAQGRTALFRVPMHILTQASGAKVSHTVKARALCQEVGECSLGVGSKELHTGMGSLSLIMGALWRGSGGKACCVSEGLAQRPRLWFRLSHRALRRKTKVLRGRTNQTRTRCNFWGSDSEHRSKDIHAALYGCIVRISLKHRCSSHLQEPHSSNPSKFAVPYAKPEACVQTTRMGGERVLPQRRKCTSTFRSAKHTQILGVNLLAIIEAESRD
mmetsp:Transcript_4852/g.11329  ORF Transcript_4852/g.11329 Transcript_4852/m.11329 type:complete len:378 (-) Transcript_4852:68-1201(-)